MYNILICDDERDIVSALKIYLTSEGYGTFEAYDGAQALSVLRETDVSLVLLDVMMPVMDGIAALAAIRAESNVPVIMLTARGEDNDKILGLNIGADDYITKPFNPLEVTARVRSQIRRYTRLGGSPEQEGELRVGVIALDNNRKSVTNDGDPISLTPTEFEIMRLLMTSPGRVYSPREIYERVWRDNPIGAESTVAVHIRHLREKLEINPAEPRYLKVVWGQGYKIDGGGR